MDEKRKFFEKKSRSDHQAEEEEQEEEQTNEEQKQEQQSPKLSEKTKPKGPIRYVSNPNSSRSSNQATVRRTGRLSKGNAAYDSSQEEVIRNETNHGAMIARNESVPGAYVGRGRALGLNVEGWIERDTSMDRSNQSNRDVAGISEIPVASAIFSQRNLTGIHADEDNDAEEGNIIADAVLVQEPPFYLRRRFIFSSIFFLIVVLIILIMVFVVIVSTETNATYNATMKDLDDFIPTYPPTMEPSVSFQPIADPSTRPSYAPSLSLSSNPSISMMPSYTDTRLQRVALNSFFVHSYGGSWLLSTNWITKLGTCEWYGIECEEGLVTKIDLRANGLSGDLNECMKDLVNVKGLDYIDISRNPGFEPATSAHLLCARNVTIIVDEQKFQECSCCANHPSDYPTLLPSFKPSVSLTTYSSLTPSESPTSDDIHEPTQSSTKQPEDTTIRIPTEQPTISPVSSSISPFLPTTFPVYQPSKTSSASPTPVVEEPPPSQDSLPFEPSEFED